MKIVTAAYESVVVAVVDVVSLVFISESKEKVFLFWFPAFALRAVFDETFEHRLKILIGIDGFVFDSCVLAFSFILCMSFCALFCKSRLTIQIYHQI